jgi:hypothetical protein
VVVALGFALAAVGIAYLLGSTPAGRSAEHVVHELVVGLRDAWWWRPLRGGLGRIVPAASVAAIVVLMMLVQRRHDLPITVGAAIVVVGANLTDQAVKHGVLPFPPSARPGGESLLSGHPPLVMSVALLAVLVTPIPARRRIGGVMWAGTALVVIGVVVAGWHTIGETLAPALMFASWAGLRRRRVRCRPCSGWWTAPRGCSAWTWFDGSATGPMTRSVRWVAATSMSSMRARVLTRPEAATSSSTARRTPRSTTPSPTRRQPSW